jgi:hypothetical protein
METTYIGAALGFRAWRVDIDQQLSSAGHGSVVWRPGINVAYCAKHTAPANGCHCGLYAYHQLDTLMAATNERLVCGIVAARGRVEVHELGWRAEEVSILALIAPSSGRHFHIPFTHHSQERIAAIAERYQVPVVGADTANSWARAYAEPVPEADRPQADDADSPIHRQLAIAWLLIAALIAAFILLPIPVWQRSLSAALITLLVLALLNAHRIIRLAPRYQRRLQAINPWLWFLTASLAIVAIGQHISFSTATATASALPLDQQVLVYYRAHHRWPNIATLTAFPEAQLARPGLLGFVENGCLLMAWYQLSANQEYISNHVITKRWCPAQALAPTTS